MLSFHRSLQTCKSRRSVAEIQPSLIRGGHEFWFSKSLLKDARRPIQAHKNRKNTGAKRFAPIIVTKLIVRNSVKLDLSDQFKMQHLVHVSQTNLYVELSGDITRLVPENNAPITPENSEKHIVKKVRADRRKGRGYQLLAIMMGDSLQGALWNLSADAVEIDRIIGEIRQM